MKTLIVVDEKLLPRAKGFRTVFINGALAWHSGRPRESNPYDSDFHFNRAWDDGWQAAPRMSFADFALGDVLLSVPKGRDRAKRR